MLDNYRCQRLLFDGEKCSYDICLIMFEDQSVFIVLDWIFHHL